MNLVSIYQSIGLCIPLFLAGMGALGHDVVAKTGRSTLRYKYFIFLFNNIAYIVIPFMPASFGGIGGGELKVVITWPIQQHRNNC